MLRLGADKDFDALFPIYMDPSVNPYLSFEIMDEDSFRPIFKELTESGTLYVYENTEGQITATCIVRRYARRCAHVACLTTLATHPKFQRQGIGSKFMRDLIAELRQGKGIERIELYAEADNLTALEFYRKLGFQLEGCMKKYYKRAHDDHYVDELILGLVFD